MDIEMVISIIGSSSAVVVSIISVVIGFIRNKKSDVLSIVTKTRLESLKNMREAHYKLMAYSEIALIKYSKNCQIKEFIYLKELSLEYNKIREYIKPIYKIDSNLLNLAQKVYDLSVALFNNEDVSKDLTKVRDQFDKTYHLYDWSYWQYIQDQAKGHILNSSKDFDKEYNDFIESLKNSDNTIYSLQDLEKFSLKNK